MEMIFQFIAHFHKKLRLCTWPHFEGEGFWNSEVAYSTAKLKNLCIAQLRESKPSHAVDSGFSVNESWIPDSNH